jgi:CRP-like cAMP-binding protein
MIWIMFKAGVEMSSLESFPPELLKFDPVLIAATKNLQCPAGQVLFRAGEQPHWLFFVLQGQALLQRVTVEGTSVTLQRTNRGFLAEASLTTSVYHCEALCQNQCKLLVFPLKELRDAIDRHAHTRWAWITLLSTQSRQQRLRIERLALNSLRDRLKHLVLTEGTASGSYTVPGTRAALAGELGVTPAALYRTLASLSAARIISLSQTTICWHG